MAGVDLLKKIIEETNARTDQDHLPVTLLSVPEDTPDRTAYLLGREKNNPAYPISQLFLRLEAMGAVVAAIPCNTAHAAPIFGTIKQELGKANSKLRLLSLIEETVTAIKNGIAAGGKVGVLSTTGTYKAGVYREALQDKQLEVIELNEVWRERVHNAIYNTAYGIKAFSSPVNKLAVNELTKAMNELIRKGADAVILGCTEIPLAITNPYYKGIPLIDPSRILARSLIRALDPSKLKTT